ncbi:MAG: SDR family NAD(P)-dependent oxidoreductase [Herbinix sp.]|nr:SDR family NAD(P)-dependent oxidoreductase [Herbinix sp.]
MNNSTLDISNLNLDNMNNLASKYTERVADNSSQDVAIIGMSIKISDLDNSEDFWNKIRMGTDFISDLSEVRKKDIETYLRNINYPINDIKYLKGAFFNEIDKFDYKFFRLTPKEATFMNPVQRVFLETAWETIEDAGYSGKKISGSKTGVFLGYIGDMGGYQYKEMISAMEGSISPISYSGNLASIIPSRISYLLNLKGPSVNIDSACSSSLLAIHMACRALQNGDCDMSLAGGIKVDIIPLESKEKVGIESGSYKTRSFDDASDGTGFGEGSVAILLKPLNKALADNDHIYAVIKGTSVNQDGNSLGITAPNVAEQTNVITKAWNNARINPETITYIEAHGTATKLGDPVEIEGIQKAFNKYTNKKQFCAIGSVKTNIGHLYEASGIAGLIKIIMMMRHGEIPPTLHFDRPNRNINFLESAVYINDTLTKWKTNGLLKRSGISAFGFSGTNCHVVIEEAPDCKRSESNKKSFIFAVSAMDMNALNELVLRYKRLIDHEEDLDIGGMSYTMLTGRGHYDHRLAFRYSSFEQLREYIDSIVRNGVTKDFRLIHFGKVKTIHTGVDSNEDGIITDKEKQKITNLANMKSIMYANTNQDDVLDEICSFYIKGADIDWELLFQGTKYAKLNLPTYPFQRERCWIDSNKESEAILDCCYHVIGWSKQTITNKIESLTGKTVLVFKDKKHESEEIIQCLRSEGLEVIEVENSRKYKKINDHTYNIGNSYDDTLMLMKETESRNISYILHMATISKGQEIKDMAQLRNSQENGVFRLFYLAKAIFKLEISKISIFVVSKNVNEVTGDEEEINPENATIFGLSSVLSKEFSDIQFRCIDVDSKNTKNDVLDEMKIESESGIDIVAYRNGYRFIKELKDIDIKSLKDNLVEIKDGNTYLITGGMGEIGLEVAKYIATKAKVKIGLLSRRGLPDRLCWNDIIKKNEDVDIIQRIISIKSIEALGSEVVCLTADISDYETLRSELDKLRANRCINGIFQCAGIAGEGFVITKDEADFVKVLNPKVYGTWSLGQLTQADNLDFFVMFSSIASILSLAGQGDYTASNAYMDSFSSYMRKKGRKALSINWTAWKEIGMAAKYGFQNEKVFLALSTKEAIESLSGVLGKNLGQVVIGKINYDSLTREIADNFNLHLSNDILQRLPDVSENSVCIHNTNKKVNPIQCKLVGDYNREYSETEKCIAGICCEELGYKEINVAQSFFDMGADSILINQIFARIDKIYPKKLSIAKIFAHPTVAKLAEFLTEDEKIDSDYKNINSVESDDIAIIGISGKFPGADNVEEFWSNLRMGYDYFMNFSETRIDDVQAYLTKERISADKTHFQQGAYFSEIDKFDYKYFKISPKEASLMDPNQRLFLETAYSAIEDAGYGGERISGTKTGIYVGYATNIVCNYSMMISKVNPESLSICIPGNLASIIPGRLSYMLDLKGPSLSVDTACSSSLVAVHLACDAIKKGECEMAIAGGVKINLLPIAGKVKLGIESSDDRTRAFDDNSDGTGIGEGVAAVLLKPLKNAILDRDHINAVIKGSAVNQDGYSVGISAPNMKAQTDVIINAWENARIDPETISFIETHGTGTKIGDVIEVEGIESAFRKYTDKKQFCAISSVKTNIGHLYEAAGIAGFIKAVLSLKYGELVPNLFFERPNHRIDFSDSPTYVNDQLIKWETGNNPRRCGVSSFGFSGTNCHIVLEEYKDDAVGKDKSVSCDNDNNLYRILALSAKSQSALLKIIHNYTNYLHNENINIDDMCFIANTGREHHNYRIVVIAKSLKEFRQKLNDILVNGMENIQDNDIFYSHSNDLTISQSTDNEVMDSCTMSQQVKDFINMFLSSDRKDVDCLKEIGHLYVSGAKVVWNELYAREDRKKIQLPIYPFERYRCWMEDENTDDMGHSKDESVIHPLIGKYILNTMNQDIYSTIFDIKKHFVLSDHIIEDTNVIPGTTYIEIAVQLGRRYYHNSDIELRDVMFFSPCVFYEEERREVQIIIHKKDGFLDFSIVSQDKGNESENEWLKHAEGRIYKLEPIKERLHYEIDDLKNKICINVMSVEQNKLTKGFMKFGPRWLNFHKIWLGNHEALAKIELPRQFAKDLDDYFIHPAMLDMANAAMILVGGNKYLPVAYQSMKFYGPTPSAFYSYLHEDDKSANDETKTYDIKLADPEGNVFAVIESYQLKKVHEFKKNSKKRYHKIDWRICPLTGELQSLADKKILVIKKQGSEFGDEVSNELLNLNANPIQVDLGSSFEKLDDSHYTISTIEMDYVKLFESLNGITLSHVVYLYDIDKCEDYTDVKKIDSNLDFSINNFFLFIKNIVKLKNKSEIKILLVSSHSWCITGEEEYMNPFASGLFGLAKVAENELNNISCCCVDTDYQVTAIDIVKELQLEKYNSEYAYRRGKRYEMILDNLDLKTLPSSNIEIKENGVYVITGGLGGIGLELSKYLANRNIIQLMLISRSKIADRSEWNDILAQHSNTKLCEMIHAIRDIEMKGSRVTCYSADVSRLDELSIVFEDIRINHGKIDGVIHCAGIAGEGFMYKKEMETFQKVIRPKIHGACYLEYLVRNEKPDFFVLCSSVASLITVPGQGDYTAANAFLDSFAQCCYKEGLNVKVINWPAWLEVGMAKNHGVNEDTMFKAITNAEADRAFEDILERKITNVIVGELSQENMKKMERIPITVSRTIDRDLQTDGSYSSNSNVSLKQDSEFHIINKEDSYDSIASILSKAWGKVLGIKDMDVNESFFDLGGDSLLATHLLREISHIYQERLDISDLFSYPSIHMMAEYIYSKMHANENQKKETVDSILHEDNNYLESIMEKLANGEISIDEVDSIIKL